MKKFITALSLIISMACFAQADQHSISYSVQIATYKNLPENFVASAEKFGSVHTSQAGELTRVSIGSFNHRSEAQDLLSQLKQAGYADAFINRTGSRMTSTQHHDNSHHNESPSSEMAKFRNLSDLEKEQAVFVDGKLHLKQDKQFVPVP